MQRSGCAVASASSPCQTKALFRSVSACVHRFTRALSTDTSIDNEQLRVSIAQQINKQQGPGRSCPLSYRYTPKALKQAPVVQVPHDTMYIIGGLYGNLHALDTIMKMSHEDEDAALVFNGDFNFINVDDTSFEEVNKRVLQWPNLCIKGNIESEISQPSDAGCGCAYPEWVNDAFVQRSNEITQRLRECAERQHQRVYGAIEQKQQHEQQQQQQQNQLNQQNQIHQYKQQKTLPSEVRISTSGSGYVSEQRLDNIPLPEIKNRLRRLGLSTSGRKQDLVQRLRENGCTDVAAPDLSVIDRLKQLPRFMVLSLEDVADRVAVVHGDANSLAGWDFSVENLTKVNESPPRSHQRKTIDQWFRQADTVVFASSHTCLPTTMDFMVDGKMRAIVNNGAAGMANFDNTRFGVVTRISTRFSIPHNSLYGITLDKLRIDALPIPFEWDPFERWFLSNWRPGSAAHQSYYVRMKFGAKFYPHQAALGDVEVEKPDTRLMVRYNVDERKMSNELAALQAKKMKAARRP